MTCPPRHRERAASGQEQARSNSSSGHPVKNERWRCEDRLPVHWFPEVPSLDALRIEPGEHGVTPPGSRSAGAITPVSQQLSSLPAPPSSSTPRGASAAAYRVRIDRRRSIIAGNRAELGATEGGQEVGEAVVVADLLVLVPRHRLARLRRELAGVRHQIAVVAQQHPAAGGRHDLVAVEGEARTPRPNVPADRPSRVAPSASAASSTSGMPARRPVAGSMPRVVARPAEQVDRHARHTRRLPRPRACRRLDRQGRVDVRVLAECVHEHRFAPV